MDVKEGPITQQILVATDFSDNAEAAVTFAVRTAGALGARLHLLHVLVPGEMDVARLLAYTASAAGPTVSVVATAAGHPAEEILRYATKHGIDLIVIGAHGRTGLSRLLLGNVAERVLRAARCPVLVVPARPVETEPAREAPAPPVRRCIVCGASTIDLICEPCRARIRGEALEHKYREERAGRR
jgi:nucleotide-binding universal stress UspA family protein